MSAREERLEEMLAAALQSLDTVTAVRDVTEQARLELLTSLQRMGNENEVLRAEVMRLQARYPKPDVTLPIDARVLSVLRSDYRMLQMVATDRLAALDEAFGPEEP